MKTEKQITGTIGETLTCRYLEENGYQIAERNYRCRDGEIDIIAVKDKIMAFVEVKTRHLNPKIRPCLDVTRSKQTKIMRTAYLYMKENQLKTYVRFDISEVYLKPNVKELHHIHYIKNAFYRENTYESF